MRRNQQLRRSGSTRTGRRLAFSVAAIGILAAVISSGAVRAGLETAEGAAAATPAYGGGYLMAADPTGGYWTASSTGSVISHGGAGYLRLSGPLRRSTHSAHCGDGVDGRRPGLLAGGVRRGCLFLW